MKKANGRKRGIVACCLELHGRMNWREKRGTTEDNKHGSLRDTELRAFFFQIVHAKTSDVSCYS